MTVTTETGLNMALPRGLLVSTGLLELELVLLVPCLLVEDFDCLICFNDLDVLDVLHFSIWLLFLFETSE